MKNNRAYSTLQLKADQDNGIITGIASTPETDRQGDVLLPEGAEFRLPIPLLYQHDHSQPLGKVTSARVTARGIEIVASVALGVSTTIDNAFRLIKAGLVQGLSVGFRGLEVEGTRTGRLYRRWELLELSAVTLPCNAGATITSVKAACGIKPQFNGSLPLVNIHLGSVRLTQPGIRLTQPGVRLSR